MKKRILWIVLASCVFSFAARAAFELAKDGKTTASVTLAANAAPPEQLAKRELESYVQKIVGSPLGTDGKNRIFIGTVSNTPGLPKGIQKKLNDARNDAFHISIAPGKILITGKDSRSVLFGTYAFLEKYLGVRWFYPGEMGEYCPVKKSILLPDAEDFQQADYQYRELSVCGSSNDFISTYDWMTRNRMHISAHFWQLPKFSREEKLRYRAERGAVNAVGGHNGAQLVVPKELFKDHPEYFALKNGKRTHEGRVNRCLSHPYVQDKTVEAYVKAVKADPNVIVDFIGEDDSEAFCECGNCKKMGTYNGKYSVSNLFHRYFKAVGDRILKECPEAHLRFWAYWNYRDVPEDPAVTYFSKNSHVWYATHQKCYVHRFSPDSVCNQKLYEGMTEWKKRTREIGVYDYRHDSRCYYAPFEFILADDLKTFRKMGAVGWADEVNTAYGNVFKSPYTNYPEEQFLSAWQTHYVASKLLWDSSLDAEKLLDEAYDLYYGKAAPVMKQYHAYRRTLWESAPGHAILGGSIRTAYCLNVPGSERKLNEYLDQALRLADTEMGKKRIGLDRKCLNQYWKEPSGELKKILGGKKELVPQKAGEKIVIDGKFDEKTWVKTLPIDGFLTAEKQPAKENTKVRVAYDDQNLYIAVNADNKNAWSPVRAGVREHDGPVWNDDSIEIQLAPPNESGEFYHLIINTNGVLYDASCIGQNFDKKFESGAEIKAVKDGTGYNYEIRIPLSPMKVKIDPAKAWKMHFMRTVTNLQPPTSSEWSSVDGVRPHHTEMFRKAVFANDYIRNGNFAEIVDYKTSKGAVVKFPKYWDLAGNAIEKNKIIPTANGNHVWIDGVMFIGFGVPKDVAGGEYVFTVRAKGTKNIHCFTWSWEGYSPRTNHRREDFKNQPLTPEFKDYTFKSKFLPKESWYIFYIGGEDITVESVTCTIVP
ncbi:MAG: hypothetical protein BWY31_01073 [Lentisphaerae bacterium ADurb.Bin242]|nr:MAG: hypothetical protein BWY31_01073 [Lentisphaerae bacterium ADurb.Bin242]